MARVFGSSPWLIHAVKTGSRTVRSAPTTQNARSAIQNWPTRPNTTTLTINSASIPIRIFATAA